MRNAKLPLPEIGAIAATRAMAGAGAALLVSNRIPEKRRRPLGMTLLLIGAITTIPLLLDIAKRLRADVQDQTQN